MKWLKYMYRIKSYIVVTTLYEQPLLKLELLHKGLKCLLDVTCVDFNLLRTHVFFSSKNKERDFITKIMLQTTTGTNSSGVFKELQHHKLLQNISVRFFQEPVVLGLCTRKEMMIMTYHYSCVHHPWLLSTE